MPEIKVPQLGESVSEATIAKWFKAEGEAVQKDELLVELETDKVTLEVNADISGVLKKINEPEGNTVEVGAVLGMLEEGQVASPVKATASAPKEEKAEVPKPVAVQPAPPAAAQAGGAEGAGPAARKLMVENQVNAAALEGSGKGGRITKGDVLGAIEKAMSGGGQTVVIDPDAEPREERVKMTKLRQVIARRLKESQNTAAILTTFNECDMSNVMALRKQYKDDFEKRHGVKLGFMSFFTKAAIFALKELPAVNAEIDGDELVYKNHYDIGMAVGTPQGLVVPVVRDADRLGFAEIEQEIVRLAVKARDGQLAMSDMQGGTFTITNGGVYGSLVSTPIINPPQSGILGLHKIQQRPMVMPDGSIAARPMMYIALSYDHRIIDGREAVTFLVKVKEAIEDPQRLLLGL